MDTTLIQLTTDGERENSYAKSADVSDREQTEPKGRWLKNSKFFLADVEDERGVDVMSVMDMLGEPRPVVKTYKYSCLLYTSYFDSRTRGRISADTLGRNCRVVKFGIGFTLPRKFLG